MISLSSSLAQGDGERRDLVAYLRYPKSATEALRLYGRMPGGNLT